MLTPENKISIDAQIQKQLFGPVCGKAGLEKRVFQAQRGHLPDGLTLDQASADINQAVWERALGPFAPKVLLLTIPNNSQTLVPEQIAVAGGWCTLRTADVNLLDEQGVIANPQTGQLEKITSVDQVAEWIKKSPAFEQVVESIGAVRGQEMIAISEERLWSERIIGKLGCVLGKRLTDSEEEKISGAVQFAEEKKFQMTQRYLQLVGQQTGASLPSLKRIVDQDVWQELAKARNELLMAAGTNYWKLSSDFKVPLPGIKSLSLIWAMYSEPYFEQLKAKGLIGPEIKRFFVVEPILHTQAFSKAGDEIVWRIYQTDAGRYFGDQGINPNTGFIAFMECLSREGKSSRRSMNLGAVPNIVNWESMFNPKSGAEKDNQVAGLFRPENNLAIDPAANSLFVWALNLCPFGQCQKTLLDLTQIPEKFRNEKQRLKAAIPPGVLKKNPEARTLMQNQTSGVKNKCLDEVMACNQILAEELKYFFRFLDYGEL